MNQQPAEKQHYDESGTVEVFKIFPTIQGEGPFSGERAIFIRLSGCNLMCPMCDTDYTSMRYPVAALDFGPLLRAHGGPGHLVVITGGEPFRQKIGPMVEAILAAGFRVQIETNGTLYQELPFDRITIVCSPKTGAVHQKLRPHIAAYKYVAHCKDIAGDDGLPNKALGHTAAPRLARPHAGYTGPVYLQPIDEEDETLNREHLRAVAKSVMEFGHKYCLQTHKYIGVE